MLTSLQLNADVVASDAVNQLVQTVPEVETKALQLQRLARPLHRSGHRCVVRQPLADRLTWKRGVPPSGA